MKIKEENANQFEAQSEEDKLYSDMMRLIATVGDYKKLFKSCTQISENEFIWNPVETHEI